MSDMPSISPSFLRLKHIIGDGNTPPIIPISKSSWWDGVKKGKYPQPIKIGDNITVWRSDDIQQHQ
jgi:prophage regulatory protein